MRAARARRSLLLLSAALAAAFSPGCAGSDGGELGAETPDPEDLEGAADSLFRPTEHGDLPLVGEAVRYATLAPDAGYHAWFFDVVDDGTGAPSEISLATDPDEREGAGTGEALDTVLYLYRQGEDGRWGRYIGKNDDRDATTRFSELRERDLAPGRYRVIAKGARACSSRASANSPYCGSFAVTALCHFGPACVTDAPTPDDCDGYADALDDCRGLRAEPFDTCVEIASIDRADLHACCDADDSWAFCPVPEPADPALLDRCQTWSTLVVECESDGEDLAQCGAEQGFTSADLTECCEADDVFYFCSLG